MLADSKTNFFVHFLLTLLRIIAEKPCVESFHTFPFMAYVENNAKLLSDSITFLVLRVRNKVSPSLQI